jgi:hypothetical protein
MIVAAKMDGPAQYCYSVTGIDAGASGNFGYIAYLILYA